MPEVAKCLRDKQYVEARLIVNRSARYLFFCGLSFVALAFLFIYWFGSNVVSVDPIIFDTFIRVISFWFFAYLFQGVGLLYLQLVNVFLMPKLAAVINFIRFLVLGVPGLYFASEAWQLDGLVYGVPIVQATSLVVTYSVFEFSWKKYQRE